jgi:signal transduction histidine kinase/CheY-like chemotaxis protein
MAIIRVLMGGRTWKVPLDELTTIGRDVKSRIALSDSFVSRHHAEIRAGEDGAFWLADLGTPNGTHVDGERVDKVALKHGDEIRIGSARLRFEDDEDGSSTAEIACFDVGVDELPAEWVPLAGDPRYPPAETVEDAATLRLPYEKLRLANTLARTISAASDLRSLLLQIADTTTEQFEADRGAVILIDPKSTEGGKPARITRQVARRRVPAEGKVVLPEGIVEQVIERRCGLVTGNARIEGDGSGDDHVVRSLMCAPMMHRGVPHGIIYLDSEKPGVFSAVDLELLGGVANQAAVAISDALGAERIKKMEAEQRARLDALVGALPDAVVLFDVDRRIVLRNERAGEALALLAPEAGSEPVTTLAGRPLAEVIAEARGGACELRLDQPTRRTFLVEAPAIAGQTEAEAEVALVIRDVTDERQQQEMAAQQERLAVVGQLSAGIAHEINNPLTYVLANLDFVASELPDFATRIPADRYAEMEEAIREAREGADRVRGIVHDMKVFSRPGEEKVRPVPLQAMLEAGIHMLRNEIRHRAQLTTDYRAQRLALASEARLEHVFLNILINATQALPVGAAEKNRIRVETYDRDDGRVVVEISDTGPGVPAPLKGRIFEPFFTTKPVGQGTGLGLFVCHGVIAGIGGEIVVEDAPGGGALFRIVLPAAVRVRDQTGDGDATTAGGARRARILIVDDEALVAASLRRWLRDHDVTMAYSGAEAFDLLRDKDFDVVLCDLMMPEMTGMELYDKVRDELPDYERRLVFMTGGAFTRHAADFLDRVKNARLDKPIDRARLVELIGQLSRPPHAA